MKGLQMLKRIIKYLKRYRYLCLLKKKKKKKKKKNHLASRAILPTPSKFLNKNEKLIIIFLKMIFYPLF